MAADPNQDYAHFTAAAPRKIDLLNNLLADGRIAGAQAIAEELIDRMRGVIAYCEAKKRAP